VSNFLRDEANINAVWASAIIEECTRLGLTYFCVAPGSRSSHLAIAAANHPLTTCLACFDERSLAFHAIGYAKGSLKPAVIITSSGTAVSNLLPAVRVVLIYASLNYLVSLLHATYFAKHMCSLTGFV
jgi:isochorismate synthase/2-succinyl-5-enolpyruvyl-6-hydroxy-3-cyclohexene-1-carboxylate synthase/2-succinyl-6-hydroxy-2,4-cyclohexadiene-1-carboxylate synthase/O-succinylbenzoate synthase